MKLFTTAKAIVPFVVTFLVGVMVASVLGYFSWSGNLNVENSADSFGDYEMKSNGGNHIRKNRKHRRCPKEEAQEQGEEGVDWMEVPPPGDH